MNDSKNSGKKFEEKVADCYRKLGYDVKMNQSLCGFQIDLVIEKRDGGFLNQAIVECKDKQRIGNKDRDQILAQQSAIHKQYPTYKWIVVSSHGIYGITPDTLTAFKAVGVQFVSYADLLEDIVKPGTSTIKEVEPPTMPPKVQKKTISVSRKISAEVFDKIEQLKLEESSTPEISKPQRHPTVQIEVGITSIDFSQDEKFIAFGNNKNKLILWDVEKSKLVRIFTFKNRINFTDPTYFSPSKKFIMGGSAYRRLVWDLETGKPVFTDKEILEFSSNGKYIISCLKSSYPLNIYDIESQKLVSSIKGNADFCSVKISPDDKYIVSQDSNDIFIKFFQTTEGKLLYNTEAHIRTASFLFSYDVAYFAAIVGKNYENVCIWNVKDGKLLYTLKPKYKKIDEDGYGIRFHFSPDSKRLITWADYTLQIWDIKSGECLHELHGHTNLINSLDFSPDGKYIATGSSDNTVRIWDTETGKCLNVSEGYSGEVYTVRFAPNGKYLIATGVAGRLQFVNHQTGKTFLYRYVFGKDAWLDLLPDGRFDASPEGMKYLSYTETDEDNQGNPIFKSYPAEELKDEFHQPQAVKDILGKYQKA